MKKTLKLEIPIPEYNWVDVATLYRTPLGEFESEFHVQAIGDLIAYMGRLREINFLINSDHQHVRSVWCRELIRSRLHFINPDEIYHYGEKLSHFLQGFEERTGYDFHKYKYEPIVLSNGKKIQFKTFTMMFDTEEEALRHIAKIYISSGKFDYQAIEEQD